MFEENLKQMIIFDAMKIIKLRKEKEREWFGDQSISFNFFPSLIFFH